MLEVTVILVLPDDDDYVTKDSDYADFMDSPSRVILTLSPSWPAFPSTLMRS